MNLHNVKLFFIIFVFECALSCYAYSSVHDSDEVQMALEKINVSPKAVLSSPITNTIFEIGDEPLITIDGQNSDGDSKVKLIIINACFSFNVKYLAEFNGENWTKFYFTHDVISKGAELKL